jgi:hypothetical protein
MLSSLKSLSLASSIVLALTAMVHAQSPDPAVIKTESGAVRDVTKTVSSVGRGFTMPPHR